MNILFIWYGLVEPLYEWRHKCIARALEVYPDANVTVITCLKDFYGCDVVDAREVIEEMAIEGYEVNINNFVLTSDVMRFWWLSKHPNTLYMDTDTWCIKPMPITKEPGKVAIEALWNGEDTKTFGDFLDARDLTKHFVTQERKLQINLLDEYFVHKPFWAKEIRKHFPQKNPITVGIQHAN